MPDVARDATRGLLLVLGAEHVDQRYALDTIAAGAKVSAISMAHFTRGNRADGSKWPELRGWLTAKGIASGLPLGVTSSRAALMTWPPGAHASTFGGNPVSCAAAIETIRVLKNGLMQNAETVGAHLMARLRDIVAGKDEEER